MKKKFKNKKAISLAVAGLAAVSVATVGFSAWIIGATSTAVTESVAVTVGDVQDNSLAIAEKSDSHELALKFDANASLSGNGAGEYIKASQGSTTDMAFTVGVRVSGASAATFTNNFKGLTVKFTDTSGIFADLLTADAIATPIEFGETTTTILDGVALSSTANKNSGTAVAGNTSVYTWNAVISNVTEGVSGVAYDIVITFNFGWGDGLDNKDPVYVTEAQYTAASSKYKAAIDALDEANAAIEALESDTILGVEINLASATA